jgi:nucleoside-diphosphate-sugar epimerase
MTIETTSDPTYAVVAGGGGFIGGYLVGRLLAEGHTVRSVDIKPISEWYQVHDGAENIVADLSQSASAMAAVDGAEAVYNLAADMGGMGFITMFKAKCMLSVLINTNLLMASTAAGVQRYFYASSACIYPAGLQDTPEVVPLAEDHAYPAMPEDGYGWEKLFSERMCRHFAEDFGLVTRVARFHNVYGPNGTWEGGREKAPAAICRKVAYASVFGDPQISVWGDGLQTRSFMYIDDCIDGIMRIMASDIDVPINLGSAELVSINQMVEMISEIAGVDAEMQHDLSAPQGVRGRTSDNTMIKRLLDWEPRIPLSYGLAQTYGWIHDQVLEQRSVRVSV